MARLSDVVAAIERRYDPSSAAEWDSVGLVCGDPDVQVTRVHVAVDPVEVIAEEAIGAGAQLLFTHHPLFLGGTESVAATTAKGRIVHRLVTHGVALYVAHTNADIASPGVSDALAESLGLVGIRMIEPSELGGLGRIGELPEPMPLREFVAAAAAALPATRWGVRAAGDPDRRVETVAVCGGSGGELAEAAAAAGADVLLTSDLKHHRTSEAVADLGIALVDAAHWATEQPWVLSAATLLAADLRDTGTTVEAIPSLTVTDPWTLHSESVHAESVHAHSPEEP
jgi:dinuclear metal center YbgI/SA1388 family protein